MCQKAPAFAYKLQVAANQIRQLADSYPGTDVVRTANFADVLRLDLPSERGLRSGLDANSVLEREREKESIDSDGSKNRRRNEIIINACLSV